MDTSLILTTVYCQCTHVVTEVIFLLDGNHQGEEISHPIKTQKFINVVHEQNSSSHPVQLKLYNE